jgi:PAS domain S-box-containing protein
MSPIPDSQQTPLPPMQRSKLAGDDVFQLLVDAVTDYAIFLLDASGHIRTWNLGAERIKHYTAPEVIGQHFSIFYTQEDRAAGRPERNLRDATEHGRVEDEGWRVRKDGSRFWADVIITALPGKDGQPLGFAKVTRDLTERRAAEERERLLVAEQRAREASDEALRARDRFLSIASHELRTPIATVQLAAEAMARAHESGILDDERLGRSLGRLRNATRRLTTLVNELLDVARLESQRVPVNAEPTDIGALVSEVVERLRDAGNPERVRYEAPSGQVADVDPLRLDQVVTNLIENALKYSGEGSPVDVDVTGDQTGVTVRVSDQGIGLDPDAQRWLFEPFGRGDNAGTTEGIGLGLYISRQIVQLHGGRIDASSPGPGRGSTFEIWLPLRQEASA